MTLFIADDSDCIRDRLTSIFSFFPEVQLIGEARDVPEAIEQLRDVHPDVVFLDLQFPNGTGFDVLKAIKSQKEKQTIVVILTNHSYPQYREKCQELGADYFFDKSHDFDLIVDLLEDMSSKDVIQ